MPMSKSDTIQELLDQIEELCVHPRNQDKLKKWVRPGGHAHDNKWRGVPAPADVVRGQIPIVVNMELSLKSDIFGFSVKEYFHNAEVYLENYLKHVSDALGSLDDYYGDYRASLEDCGHGSVLDDATLEYGIFLI